MLEVFRVRVAVHARGGARTSPRSGPSPAGAARSRRTGARDRRRRCGLRTLEELVLRGLTPTVGIVSVFDTDYATAQRYELEVVSAPPFQPFPAEALQTAAPSAEADCWS